MWPPTRTTSLDSIERIQNHYRPLLDMGLTTTMGGDHTIVLPILRAMASDNTARSGSCTSTRTPTSTTRCSANGSPTARRSGERSRRVCSIAAASPRSAFAAPVIRPTTSTGHDEQGFRVVQVEECWHRSLDPLMAEVRTQLGTGPVYLSFDIDGLDPSFAPGTGTPEIGGLTIWQGMEIIRGCRGLNLVGGDVVEVAPIYDVSGMTSLVAANLLYEMLCVLPGVEMPLTSQRSSGRGTLPEPRPKGGGFDGESGSPWPTRPGTTERAAGGSG